MSDQTRVSHPIYNLLPTEIERVDSLAELALDMHGRGITPPTKCGVSLIPKCARSRITPGSSCRRHFVPEFERRIDQHGKLRVLDKKWQRMATFFKPFTKATIRYFDYADATEARKWLGEA